jgi:hypothetical protein
MYVAAIGGMQLKSLRGYFKVILPTLKVLKAANATDGCVYAKTYKHGDVFFAVSVWDDPAKMKAFASTGLHGQLMPRAMEHLGMFYNHSEEVEAVPSPEEMAAMWRDAIAARGGEGTVGGYGPLDPA